MSTDDNQNTLVISSGRCGSTLVADMIGDHPDVLPLIEFFGSQYQANMHAGELDGERFWALLSEPWLSLNTALRLGRVPAEVRCALPSQPPYPQLCGLQAFTLPALADDSEKLFAELSGEIREWPCRSLGDHYRALFQRLQQGSGCGRWMEKSAASSEYVRELLDLLPGVRIVHLTRDVIDVAISMTNHPMFVFADLTVMFVQRCGFDPFMAGSMPEDYVVPDDLVPFLPHNITTDMLDARSGSFSSIMNLVSAQAQLVRRADDALAAVDPSLVHRISYEQLLADPTDTLEGLAAFLDLDGASAWVTAAREQIRPARAPRITINAGERAMLMGLYEQVYQADPVEVSLAA